MYLIALRACCSRRTHYLAGFLVTRFCRASISASLFWKTKAWGDGRFIKQNKKSARYDIIRCLFLIRDAAGIPVFTLQTNAINRGAPNLRPSRALLQPPPLLRGLSASFYFKYGVVDVPESARYVRTRVYLTGCLLRDVIGSKTRGCRK